MAKRAPNPSPERGCSTFVTESTYDAGLGVRAGGDIVSSVITTDAFDVLARRAVRAFALLAIPALAVVATPAMADVPEGWSNPAEVDNLEALLLLGAVPLLIFVAIAVAVYIPSMIRGERLLPDHGAGDSEWLGGPRQGARELPAADREDSRAGGASGSW